MIVCEKCLERIEEEKGRRVYSKELNWIDDGDKIIYGYYDRDGEFIEDDDSNTKFIQCDKCKDFELFDYAYKV